MVKLVILEQGQAEPKSPDSCLTLNYERCADVDGIISNSCDLGKKKIILSSFENQN